MTEKTYYYKRVDEREFISSTIYKHNDHFDITREEIWRNGVLSGYIDYEYTYDKNGNVLTTKDSRCLGGEIGKYDYVANTICTYDSRSRLLTKKVESISGNISEFTNEEYTYEGDFQDYKKKKVTTKRTGKVDEETIITNTFDTYGYITESINDITIGDVHTMYRTFNLYNDDGYKVAYRIYDYLRDDIILIEDYLVFFHNNNPTQKQFEQTYNHKDKTVTFKKYTYDSYNRLVALDDFDSTRKTAMSQYIYGYDE